MSFIENNRLPYNIYDGIKWYEDLGSLSYNNGRNVNSLNSIIFNNILYVSWSEYDSNSSVYQIR
ncbi:hypothetical protein [Clostridium sp. Marseille-Q7071]